MTRVLIVDDHEFFRACMANLVDASTDLAVAGQCGDGSEVCAAVTALQPDIVLMDLQMPRMSGLEAALALQRAGASARVIMLSAEARAWCVQAACDHGARGYVLKGSGPAVVLDAVRHVAAGGTVWPPELVPAFRWPERQPS